MDNYYVNTVAQPNGDHEVHKENCYFLPKPENILFLGNFDYCMEALYEAKKKYLTIDGCVHCIPECHRR